MRLRDRPVLGLALLPLVFALAAGEAAPQGSSAGLWQPAAGADDPSCPLLVIEIYASGHGAAWLNGANQNPDPQNPDLEGRVKVTKGGHIQADMSDPDGKDTTWMSMRGTFSASEMRVQAIVSGKNAAKRSALCVFRRNGATPILTATPRAPS